MSKTFPFDPWHQHDVVKWFHLSLYVVRLRNRETFSAPVWTSVQDGFQTNPMGYWSTSATSNIFNSEPLESQKHRLPWMSCGHMGTHFSCRPEVDDGWSIWQWERTLNQNLIFGFPQWKILRTPHTLKPFLTHLRSNQVRWNELFTLSFTPGNSHFPKATLIKYCVI